MPSDQPIQECPQDRLSDLIAEASASDEQGLSATEALLRDYALDPRLHFLRGSLLASLKQYPEARQAMHRAIEIAPGYAIARFQAGLLELTSGEPAAAESTWAPLQDLPSDNPLRLFATGLNHLARDEFDSAIALLTQGIALNTENLPLNRDMQMVISEAQQKLGDQPPEEPTSATDLLLRQFGKDTRH